MEFDRQGHPIPDYPNRNGQAPDLAELLRQAQEGREHSPEFASVGRRRAILKTILGHWNRGLAIARESLPLDGVTERIQKETDRLVEVSAIIRSFLEQYPTPAQAFTALTGKQPQGALTWTIRPYGICFFTSRRSDAHQFMSLGMFGHGGAMVRCAGMPEMGKYVAVINGESLIPADLRAERETDAEREKHAKSNRVGVEHELLHLYTERLFEAGADPGMRQLMSQMAEVADILRSNPPFDQCEELYRSVTDAYANMGIKHEIISYMTSDHDQLQKRNIFDSDMYGVPDPYTLYTMPCPAWNDEAVNDLYRQRRKEVGWPVHELPREEDLTAEQIGTVQRLKETRARILKPYKEAYDSVVQQWDLARTSGVPPNEVADIVIDTPFLELPAALDRFIRSRAVLIPHALSEAARKAVAKVLHLFTGMPVTFTGPLFSFEGGNWEITRGKPASYPPQKAA